MKSPSQSQNRIDWIDYAKGIGIFLVVLGHVLRGLTRSSTDFSNGNQLQFIDTWIYSFHMPLFFLLSGVLWKKLESRNIQQFSFDKLRSIMYPYMIWTGIIGSLRAISGQSEDSLGSFVVNFWKIVYQPIDILWFLYVLFLVSMIYYLLRMINIAPTFIILGAFFLYLCHSFMPGLLFWDPLDKVGIYSIYFVLGSLIGDWLKKLYISKIFLVAGTILGFSILAAAIHFNVLITKEPNLILSLLGITSCLFLAKLLYQLTRLEFLKTWGSLSLQIYVTHTIATGFTRIILQKVLHVNELIIHIGLGMIAGIGLPILLAWMVDKINFPYLFTLPRHSKIT